MWAFRVYICLCMMMGIFRWFYYNFMTVARTDRSGIIVRKKVLRISGHAPNRYVGKPGGDGDANGGPKPVALFRTSPFVAKG